MSAPRPVALSPDGAATLRQGRFYRALLVVNGQPGRADLYQAVCALGFDRAGLAVSWPGEWAADRPASWPEEHPPLLAANEFLVRASGAHTGRTRAVDRDTPLAGGGAFTVAELWDCGEAARAAPSQDPDPEPPRRAARGQAPAPEDHKTRSAAFAVAAVLAAVVAYKLIGGRHEARQEEERRDYVRDRAERLRRVARSNELVAAGHRRSDADVLAEYEARERGELGELAEYDRGGDHAPREQA